MTTPDDSPAEAPGPTPVADSTAGGEGRLSPDRDLTLDHQPILQVQGHRNPITVSCNCLLEIHITKAIYVPMGEVRDRYDTQRLYNDPANHRKPFGPAWEIHYRDVEGHREPPYQTPVSVNDRDNMWDNVCWICGHGSDHAGIPHAVAMDDGLTRYDIVDFMHQGGYTWRDEG